MRTIAYKIGMDNGVPAVHPAAQPLVFHNPEQLQELGRPEPQNKMWPRNLNTPPTKIVRVHWQEDNIPLWEDYAIYEEYTPQEWAKLCGVQRQTIYRWLKRGTVPHASKTYKENGRWWIVKE